MGKKLLQIEVGGIPDPEDDFCSITDVASRLNVPATCSSPTATATAVCWSTTPRVRRCTNSSGKGNGPGQFNNAHGIALGPDGNSTSPTEKTAVSSGST